MRAQTSKVFTYKRLKVFLSACFLWFLLLLFTNSFSFEDVFAMSGEDIDRLLLLFTLPFVFSIIACGLYAWIEAEEDQAKKEKARAENRELVISAKMDARYHIKRIPLFLALLLLSAVLQHFFYWGAFRAVAADVILSSAFILGILVFSHPLSFRRKAACWLLGLLAIVVPVPALVGLIDLIAYDIENFRFLWGRSPMVSGASLILGILVTLLVQRKWRLYLSNS